MQHDPRPVTGRWRQEYEEYLSRFQDQIGGMELGAFAKHEGQLIKKLAYEEFEPLYDEYTHAVQRYTECVERGDTINDLLVKVLRERATALVLERPA